VTESDKILAYYDKESITLAKCFIVQTLILFNFVQSYVVLIIVFKKCFNENGIISAIGFMNSTRLAATTYHHTVRFLDVPNLASKN
jgi:hypothetical protein